MPRSVSHHPVPLYSPMVAVKWKSPAHAINYGLALTIALLMRLCFFRARNVRAAPGAKRPWP